jgi:hypothetical protein
MFNTTKKRNIDINNYKRNIPEEEYRKHTPITCTSRLNYEKDQNRHIAKNPADDACRMASFYIAEMSAVLLKLSKAYDVRFLEKLFESAYYHACMEASGLKIPLDEIEFLQHLQATSRKYR